MNARIQRIRSRILSVGFLAAAVIAASAHEARATCVAPTVRVKTLDAPKPFAPTGAATLAGRGTAPALAAAPQGGDSNGGGPIVGLWQVVMTAFPGTPDQFVIDVGFQQFHSDGTELMISAGVPPTIGNVCIGVWERWAGGVIRLRHVTWNWAGNEVLGDVPTGYFLLEVTLRTDSQGASYAGTWKAASFDLGAGPLGSGGSAQPGSEFEGTLQAVKIGVH